MILWWYIHTLLYFGLEICKLLHECYVCAAALGAFEAAVLPVSELLRQPLSQLRTLAGCRAFLAEHPEQHLDICLGATQTGGEPRVKPVGRVCSGFHATASQLCIRHCAADRPALRLGAQRNQLA